MFATFIQNFVVCHFYIRNCRTKFMVKPRTSDMQMTYENIGVA